MPRSSLLLYYSVISITTFPLVSLATMYVRSYIQFMIKFTPLLFNINLTSLLLLLVVLMIPEADSSNNLTFCMPRPLATWRGVFPEKAPSLALAPQSSNSFITSMFCASTAWCRGVRPLLPSYRRRKTGMQC